MSTSDSWLIAAGAAGGRYGTSRRACSRNWRASSTSSATVTRPGAPGTPMRYSLAASETAATTRRAADNESVACPASGAAKQTTNDRQGISLRRMRMILKEDARILEPPRWEFKQERIHVVMTAIAIAASWVCDSDNNPR